MSLPREALVVFENSDFMVCAKPSGIGMHDEPGEIGFVTLVRTVLGDSVLLPAHRLDKPTSGLCIFAKSSSAAAQFGQLFERKLVTKYYLAITSKKPAKKQGAIIGDMVKTRNGSWRLTAAKTNPAITHFFSFALASGMRLILLKPSTGKTHQLRVALKALGAAIIGDERYGGESSDRLYLHAYQLEFELNGERHSFKCKPTSGELFSSEAFSSALIDIGEASSLAWPTVKINKKPL